MCAALASLPPSTSARIHDLDRVRIERALRQRARYRYVQPTIAPADDGGWLITSPCCSRNVDPHGGIIPIAWLEPHDGVWTLYARDHVHDSWLVHHEARNLKELLDEVCVDPLRVFWP
jgi:Protein of unknown function (DUF3024)